MAYSDMSNIDFLKAVMQESQITIEGIKALRKINEVIQLMTFFNSQNSSEKSVLSDIKLESIEDKEGFLFSSVNGFLLNMEKILIKGKETVKVNPLTV